MFRIDMERVERANKDSAKNDERALNECRDDYSNQEIIWINSFLGTLFMREINCKLGERISDILQNYRDIFGHIPKSWRMRLGICLLIRNNSQVDV